MKKKLGRTLSSLDSRNNSGKFDVDMAMTPEVPSDAIPSAQYSAQPQANAAMNAPLVQAPHLAPVRVEAPAPAPAPAPSAPPQAAAGWTQLPRTWELSDFQPIQKLYRGYASKVYLARDNGSVRMQSPAGEEISLPGTGSLVVLKVYDLLRLSPLTKYQLEREVRLHSAASHTNIVELIASFVQADFHILVQSYASGGDLYSYLRKQRTRIGEKRLVRMVLKPCLAALAYLHSSHIVHRDIKPENLLLDAENVIKVADFGLSVCLTEENAVTRAGTLDYMAPEVLVCPLKRLPTDYKDHTNLAYTNKVDSWSMGVLAYELMVGHSPYQQREEKALLAAIGTVPIQFPASIAPLAKDWLLAALEADPAQRASVAELITHPWVTSFDRQPAPQLVGAPSEDMAGPATPTAEPGFNRGIGLECHGEDGKKKHSLNPAVMGLSVSDGSHTPTGCRSPAALSLPTGGNTPHFGQTHSMSRLPSSPLSGLRYTAEDAPPTPSKLNPGK